MTPPPGRAAPSAPRSRVSSPPAGCGLLLRLVLQLCAAATAAQGHPKSGPRISAIWRGRRRRGRGRGWAPRRAGECAARSGVRGAAVPAPGGPGRALREEPALLQVRARGRAGQVALSVRSRSAGRCGPLTPGRPLLGAGVLRAGPSQSRSGVSSSRAAGFACCGARVGSAKGVQTRRRRRCARAAGTKTPPPAPAPAPARSAGPTWGWAPYGEPGREREGSRGA